MTLTHLEGRNDVGLDEVSGSAVSGVQAKVADEGIESHSPSNDGGVVSHGECRHRGDQGDPVDAPVTDLRGIQRPRCMRGELGEEAHCDSTR